MAFYDFKLKTIAGRETTMGEYRGKVLLIVNVASKCGFTPQYKGLQALYEKYRERGFEILGFPCNQFAGQEPATNDEIAQFCELNFGVTFPLFEKTTVNGKKAHPLYPYLKEKAPGLLGLTAIKWNFTKFLVDRQGNVLKRFAPAEPPESLEQEIEKLL